MWRVWASVKDPISPTFRIMPTKSLRERKADIPYLKMPIKITAAVYSPFSTTNNVSKFWLYCPLGTRLSFGVGAAQGNCPLLQPDFYPLHCDNQNVSQHCQASLGMFKTAQVENQGSNPILESAASINSKVSNWLQEEANDLQLGSVCLTA